MPAVNLFIGGTGVELALYIERYRKFYGIKDDLPVFALDTDAESQRIAHQELGDKLVLAPDGWLQRVQTNARQHQAANFASLYSRDGPEGSGSFGDIILRSSAQIALHRLADARGLYTLRGAGWLAWEDILSEEHEFLMGIYRALGDMEGDEKHPPTLNVVASIAGGTGSGLFIPVVAALRQMMADARPPRPLEVHAYLVTPSAFDMNWADDLAANRESLKSRGYAGAYAAFREVMALTSTADERAQPERRTVAGFPYYQGPGTAGALLQRVWWWGRRKNDATARADETFFEAGRLLTLMNHGAFYDKLGGAVHEGENRRIAAVTTIEYPKLERAETISAAAVAHLAKKILQGGREEFTRILSLEPSAAPGEPPITRPPLLEFVKAQRVGSMMAMGRDARPAAYHSVKSLLLDPLKLIKGGKPSSIPGDNLVNRITKYKSRCMVSGTNDQWLTSLAAANEDLKQRRNDTRLDLELYLQWLDPETQSWLAEAISRAAAVDTDPGKTWPSLARFDRSLRALVEDLDYARIFFSRSVRDSIDKAIPSVASQSARVEQLRVRLERLVTPQVKPKPPTAWYLHPLIGWGVIVAGLAAGSLGAAQAARSVFILGGFVSGLATLVQILVVGIGNILRGVGLPTLNAQPPAETLLALGGTLLVLGILHLVLRFLKFQTVGTQRRELEGVWVKEWANLVDAEMLDDYWEKAKAICVVLVGEEVKNEAVGSPGREPSPTTVLGKVYTMVKHGRAWTADLQAHADVAENQRKEIRRKSWIGLVGKYQRPTDAELDTVLPPIKMVATLDRVSNVKKVMDLGFGFDVPTESSTGAEGLAKETTTPFSFKLSSWTDVPRSEPDEKTHDTQLKGLYTQLNKTILPAIATRNILQEHFVQAMGKAGHDHIWLAKEINRLIKESRERNLAACLTRPYQGAKEYLCVPQDAIAEVDKALEFAQGGTDLKLAAAFRRSVFPTPFIGESIGLVQVGTFEPEAGQPHPRLEDISTYAHHEYYGQGHREGEEARAQRQYNIGNTEFHLLPELSAAARLETEVGRFERSGPKAALSPLIVQRLYGSHHAAQAIPSLFELFYLCKHRGYLLREIDRSNATPLVRWVLERTVPTDGRQPSDERSVVPAARVDVRRSTDRVPLVTWPLQGEDDIDPADGFRGARKQIAVFDAFRLCLMSTSEYEVDPPALSAPPSAAIETPQWSTKAASIGGWRTRLFAEWNALLADPEAAASTYEAMLKLAREDASLMSVDLKSQWEDVATEIFKRTVKNLGSGT